MPRPRISSSRVRALWGGSLLGEEGSKVDPLVKNCLVTKLTTVLKGPGPQQERMSPVLVCDRLKLVPCDYVQPL